MTFIVTDDNRDRMNNFIQVLLSIFSRQRSVFVYRTYGSDRLSSGASGRRGIHRGGHGRKCWNTVSV